MSQFAMRLKELRKERHLTQDQLAKKMGVSRSTIGMYEQGQREPEIDFITACAEFFNASTDFLLGNESGYYEDEETARLAQQMYDDPQMRALFDMKRGMKPEVFQAHYDMMKRLYEVEHPEDSDDFGGC